MKKFEIKAAIKQGVDCLAQTNPEWYKKIDIETLDLSKSNKCILGQLYGDFFDGQARLSISGEESFDMGFISREGSTLEYKKLTKEWKKTINKKRNEYFVWRYFW